MRRLEPRRAKDAFSHRAAHRPWTSAAMKFPVAICPTPIARPPVSCMRTARAWRTPISPPSFPQPGADGIGVASTDPVAQRPAALRTLTAHGRAYARATISEPCRTPVGLLAESQGELLSPVWLNVPSTHPPLAASKRHVEMSPLGTRGNAVRQHRAGYGNALLWLLRAECAFDQV